MTRSRGIDAIVIVCAAAAGCRVGAAPAPSAPVAVEVDPADAAGIRTFRLEVPPGCVAATPSCECVTMDLRPAAGRWTGRIHCREVPGAVSPGVVLEFVDAAPAFVPVPCE